MASFFKRVAQALAQPSNITGAAFNRIGKSKLTRELLGTSVSSAISRTGQGMSDISKTSPALAVIASGGANPGMMASGSTILGGISGFQSSQESQAETAEAKAESQAQAEVESMESLSSEKKLKANLKARQEEIMLRSGQTQKNIFGTGSGQPSGILG